ncbi:hypothetical protein EM858_14670 [Agrobacterium sp. CNPSo 2736]|uniref:hypothetical protein n=1 Tax=Agrobacterium sp. CNPSo 2736 TaxID=2499627 RepID=UPI000FDA0478|nr:hypothetical protein [Agrobacterium sp. CNPSo 2736]RVT75687.1 hypothetical protein EM858_14670 [Agrobacterium sp. CNPSo 2736]
MEYGYTLHSIRRKGDDLPVGSVEEFTNADYKDMIRLGAIREPTDDEMKLYKLAHPDEPVAEEHADDDAGGKSSGKGKGKGSTPKNPANGKADATGAGEGGEGGEGEGGALV